MNKIIISENFLNELKIKKNTHAKESGFSEVYVGDNWVKKLSIDDKYSKQDLLQFRVMSKNPSIFPETKIKKLKDGTIIILQKKVDVSEQNNIYLKVANAHDPLLHPHSYDFDMFLNSIAQNGLNESINDEFKSQIVNMRKKYYENAIINRYVEYVALANKLYRLTRKYTIFRRFQMDLHSLNFGLDAQGNIKIIDFISDRPRWGKY